MGLSKTEPVGAGNELYSWGDLCWLPSPKYSHDPWHYPASALVNTKLYSFALHNIVLLYTLLMCTVHCTDVHCTLYWCALYTVQMCTVHSTHVHCTLYWCALYTVLCFCALNYSVEWWFLAAGSECPGALHSTWNINRYKQVWYQHGQYWTPY